MKQKEKLVFWTSPASSKNKKQKKLKQLHIYVDL